MTEGFEAGRINDEDVAAGFTGDVEAFAIRCYRDAFRFFS